MRQQHAKYFVAENDATSEAADALLQHKICVFDRQFELGEVIDWHQDLLTKRNWPRRYWANIDIRDGQTIGGVKWVWELNRHHHLVTLGKAYFLSQEEKYAQEVCAQLKEWIQANPPLVGVNWISSLELAVRLINWVWTLAFVRHSPFLTQDLFERIIQSIAEQAVHVSRHLSAFSSANNHLIGEAAGLAIVGLCFPSLPSARQWRETGFDILTRELGKQIYPDGSPAEQAISYLTFVLDFNLLVWRLAELNGFAVPPIWYKRLAAACDFIRYVMNETGVVPVIGDSDNAWVIRLDDQTDVNNYRSILATTAVLLNRPELKASAGRWDEKSHWLLGDVALTTYEALATNNLSPVSSCVFRDGGYCVMRAPGRVITFDCGPLGYLSTAAHGHADALHLTISLDGQQVLVDPGAYAYQEGGKWRDYFRSTAAHNTIVVDGRNQSEMQGAFLWGHKAATRLLRWETTPEYDFAMAEHDGYAPIGIIHRRSVLFYKPGWILVVDELQGKGKYLLEQLWHLSASSRVDIQREYVRIVMGHRQWQIRPIEMPEVEMRIQNGEEAPIQGWVSPHYGQIEPAPVIGFIGYIDLPVRLSMALCFPEETNVDFSEYKVSILRLLNNLMEEVES